MPSWHSLRNFISTQKIKRRLTLARFFCPSGAKQMDDIELQHGSKHVVAAVYSVNAQSHSLYLWNIRASSRAASLAASIVLLVFIVILTTVHKTTYPVTYVAVSTRTSQSTHARRTDRSRKACCSILTDTAEVVPLSNKTSRIPRSPANTLVFLDVVAFILLVPGSLLNWFANDTRMSCARKPSG